MHSFRDQKISKSQFSIFICIIIQMFIAQSAQFTQYNYTFDLPSSRLNNLSEKNEQIHNVEQFNGEVQKQFLIKEPNQIENVFQIVVRLKTQIQGISVPTRIDDSQLLSTPDFNEIWFGSYVWPVKKNSLLYFSSKKQTSSSDKQQKLISAAYKSPQKLISTIFSQQLQIYALLSTGQIQLLIKNHEKLSVQKTYKQISQDQNQQQIQMNDAYLYYKNGRLYLFAGEVIHLVSLNQIDDGSQKKIFYKLNKIPNIGNILKVVETPQWLYLLTNQDCYRLKDKQPSVIVKYDDIFAKFPNSQKSLIDFAVFGNQFYFLSKELGLIKYSPSRNFSLLRIQHPQFSSQVNVYNHTIMITYEVGHESYIQEYQLVQKHQKFYANKIYTYHSEEQVSNVLLFNGRMIVNRGSQILFCVHSLSRNLPFTFHKKDSIIQSQIFSDQIMQLRPIQSDILELPGYLTVTENSIELIQFQSQSTIKLQQKWVSITSERKGKLDFDIEFIGTCKDSQFYPTQFCSITKSIQMSVDDSTGKLIYSWWFWVCIAGGFILLAVVTLLISCKYFTKKQNQFESLIEGRKRTKIGSIVQMSLENATEGNQQKMN